jgi:hypothetical protein
MKNRLNRFLFTSLFGAALLAGCAATGVQMRTEDGPTSARGRDQIILNNPSLNRGEARVQSKPSRPISLTAQGAEARITRIDKRQ